MSSFSLIVLLLTLTTISLFIVSMINQRQMRVRVMNQRISQFKRRALEMEELATSIEPLVESNQVVRVVNNEAISLLENVLKLSPSNAFAQMSLQAAQQRAEELRNPNLKCPTDRLMESDAAIARAQFALNEAARVVRKQQAEGKLQDAESSAMIQELSWGNYMLRIITNIAQGHRAMRRSDALRASAYYRKALEIATEGGHRDERQNQIINEIGEILNGKRQALSTTLMPETQHNPDASTPTFSELLNPTSSKKDNASDESKPANTRQSSA